MNFDLLSFLKTMPTTMKLFFVVGVLVMIGLKYLKSPKGKGLFGEKLVSHVLKSGLGPEYIVLNDIYLPLADGTTTQIDHIVVSRYGIFAVETKNYAGWIFADARSKVWTQSLYRKKSKFQNPMHQNYLHVCAIADNLGIDKKYVIGVVAFLGGCTFKTACPEGVVYAAEVADYIRTFNVQIIADSQVADVAKAISEWNNSISRETRAAHVENLKRTHESKVAGDE